MARYVIAVKRDKRTNGTTTEIAAAFPGLRLVGDQTRHIATVEAEPAAIARFRREHGEAFEIEREMQRTLPDPNGRLVSTFR